MASNEESEALYMNDDRVDLTCRWNTCLMRFNTMEDLVSHVHSSHVYHQDGMYHCMWDDCPRGHRGFNARYKMTIHLRTHTMEKPFMCKQCLKRFSRQENLRIHIRTHTGEKPYKCNTEGCGKTYSNSSDRFKHSRTHEDDRPYFCKFPNCPKRYTDPSSLRKHVKMYNHSVNRLTFSPAQQPLNSYNRPQSISPDSSRSSSSLDASPILHPPPLINPAFHQTENTINRGMSAENYEAIGRAFAARQYAHFQPMHNLVFGSERSTTPSVDPMNFVADSSGFPPINSRANVPLYMFDQHNSEIDVVGDNNNHHHGMGRAEAMHSPFSMESDQNSPGQYLPRMEEALALLYPNENRDEPGPSSLPLDLSMPSARRRRRRDQRDSGSLAWPKQTEQEK